MLTHFQYKPLFENTDIPGWRFSFYYLKKRYLGIYHPDGKVEWTDGLPDDDAKPKLEAQIHELMLYHVYDK